MPDTHAAKQPPALLKLLAHDLRWSLLQALTSGDRRVQELVAAVNEPMNLVSYHLKQLRDTGLVATRRSEADARDVYYSLSLTRLSEMYRAAGLALHPALAAADIQYTIPDAAALNILFVCTHNSARSQMAEALLRHVAGPHISVFSAGNHPTQLHPDAVRTMDALGIDIRGQHSKHLDAFAGQPFDYVITVCDRARESCPTFPGGGQYLHWGFADPAVVTNTKERRRLFQQLAVQLASRVKFFLAAASAHPTRHD